MLERLPGSPKPAPQNRVYVPDRELWTPDRSIARPPFGWRAPPTIRSPLQTIGIAANGTGNSAGSAFTINFSPTTAPIAGEMSWIVLWSYESGGSDPHAFTISSWTATGTAKSNVFPNFPIWGQVFRRAGAWSGAQTATITGNFTQGYILWQLVKVTGALTTGTNGSDAERQVATGTSGSGSSTTSTATFGGGATLNGNAIISFGLDWDVGTCSALSGHTAVYNNQDGNLGTAFLGKRETGTDTAGGFSTTPAGHVGSLAIEVASVPLPSSVIYPPYRIPPAILAR